MNESRRQQSELRLKGRRARAAMTQEERDMASARITDTVTRSGFFRHGRTIGCYLSGDAEVDTSSIIARAWTMKKRVFAPIIGRNCSMQFGEVTAETTLSPNQYGLLEPQSGQIADPHHLDFVITPLAAFDCSGNRVGMGSGYFDRCFAFLKERKTWLHPKLIGVAFECQRVDRIAPNPWDIRLYCVITETISRRCSLPPYD